MNVHAKDKATNKEQQIRIQASGGLSDADIEQMVKDAETNADADKERRAVVEATNKAESLIHATEKSLEEFGDDVPAEEKANIDAAMEDLKSAIEAGKADDIEAKADALSQAGMKLGEMAYRKAQEEAAGAPDNAEDAPADANAPSSDDKEDDVVDADIMDLEIEEDEDEKK